MKIIGTAGNDNLVGTADYDIISGGAGNDTIDGGAGSDKMAGQEGDDTFIGGAGADYMIGGAGVDTVDYDDSAGGVIVNLNTGTGSGADAAGDTLIEIENLIGSRHTDTLIGNSGDNRLDGGIGTDRLVGGDGRDVLIGGFQSDELTGGAHADTFLFATSAYGLGTGADVITDFQVGQDVIQFQRAYWGGVDSLDDLTFSQVGADTVISFGNAASITLDNVDMQQLLANASTDFLFT
jgi:Ca2+-binding RTX toxin-like protein